MRVLDLVRVPTSGPYNIEDYIHEGEEESIQERRARLKAERIAAKNAEKAAKRAAAMGSCSACDKEDSFLWEGGVCFWCYIQTQMTDEMRSFILTAYAPPCTYCGKTEGKKHFDHINMFDKDYAIMSMIHMTIEDVHAEMDKCQLLCIECHDKVTRTEMRLGFTDKKHRFNKLLRAGEDVSELRKKYREEYEAVMAGEYARIRGEVGKGGCLRAKIIS